jgi:hypothetical protein
MDESPSQRIDLARSYGTNWTFTNVSTLVEWLAITSYNMKCLDLGIQRHRTVIRNYSIFGIFVSTLSGTLSVSQIGKDDPSVALILNYIYAGLSFSIAIFTGFMKIYLIQERLEQYIKLKQEWTIFGTSVASELQLPIELRRDALHLIIKFKGVYLDLLKADVEIASSLRDSAENSLRQRVIKTASDPSTMHMISTLPHIIMDIGEQELTDLASAGKRNKDKFSAQTGKMSSVVLTSRTTAAPPPRRLSTMAATVTAATAVTIAPAAAPTSTAAASAASAAAPPSQALGQGRPTREEDEASARSDSPSSLRVIVHPIVEPCSTLVVVSLSPNSPQEGPVLDSRLMGENAERNMYNTF